MVNWREHEGLSRLWQAEGTAYADAIRAYLAEGERSGWKEELPEPQDPRVPLADPVLALVREANRAGDVDSLRARFAPAYSPFAPRLKANGQHVGPTYWVDHRRVVTRIGTSYQPNRWVVVDPSDRTVTDLPGARAVGPCPNRRFWAVAGDERVDVRDGWDGPVLRTFAWPGEWGGSDAQGKRFVPPERPPAVEQLVCWPDGNRLLVVTTGYAFALDQRGATLLLPDRTADAGDGSLQPGRDDLLRLDEHMVHGAVSPDGELVAVGSQSSMHDVYDASLTRVGRIGRVGSEYPHFAMFAADGGQLVLNSCHFYNGFTCGIERRHLRGINLDDWADDPRTTKIQDGARVYAGAAVGDSYLLGDAYGGVYEVSRAGVTRGKLHVGSTITGLDVTRDDRQLAVSTFAGFVAFFERGAEPDPQQLYDLTARETRRLILWREEATALWW